MGDARLDRIKTERKKEGVATMRVIRRGTQALACRSLRAMNGRSGSAGRVGESKWGDKKLRQGKLGRTGRAVRR